MSLRANAHGPEVVRLQQALLKLGYSLPRWGADGWLGHETQAALRRLFDEHGRAYADDDDSSVSDEELAFVYGLERSLQGSASVAAPPDPLFDLRAQASRQHDYGARPWSKVTGVCLHQTACVLGEKPERWATVGAHIGITRGGKVIHLHDFNRLIVHGNGWNSECVGIELDGMYAGVEGNPRTFWKPPGEPNRQPQSPTPELVEAAKRAIRWIDAVVKGHGGKLNVLVAHRQASKDRQSDPGSALWQAIALPMHKELGLTDGGVGFKIGSGYAIPEAWDPRCKGIGY
jgi:hypothetical protein